MERNRAETNRSIRGSLDLATTMTPPDSICSSHFAKVKGQVKALSAKIPSLDQVDSLEHQVRVQQMTGTDFVSPQFLNGIGTEALPCLVGPKKPVAKRRLLLPASGQGPELCPTGTPERTTLTRDRRLEALMRNAPSFPDPLFTPSDEQQQQQAQANAWGPRGPLVGFRLEQRPQGKPISTRITMATSTSTKRSRDQNPQGYQHQHQHAKEPRMGPHQGATATVVRPNNNNNNNNNNIQARALEAAEPCFLPELPDQHQDPCLDFPKEESRLPLRHRIKMRRGSAAEQQPEATSDTGPAPMLTCL